MRVHDKPLPGDLVIRERADRSGLIVQTVYVITSWPDPEAVVGGPYQSFGYAVRQARESLTDPSEYIWRDHADGDRAEHLEDVTRDE
jgi:hypothetical protein